MALGLNLAPCFIFGTLWGLSALAGWKRELPWHQGDAALQDAGSHALLAGVRHDTPPVLLPLCYCVKQQNKQVVHTWVKNQGENDTAFSSHG